MSATTGRTPQEVLQHLAEALGAEAGVEDSTDTFVLRGGPIRVQTARCTLTPAGRS